MHAVDLQRAHRLRRCTESGPKLTYALLFRGVAYRFGCDGPGLHLQDAVMQSYQDMIVEPLEACGSTVHIFLAVDMRGCANSTLHGRLRSSFESSRIKRYGILVNTTSQLANVRQSLNLYLPSAQEYDMLIFTRYDVRLLQPYRSWPGCQSADRIGIARRCELMQWDQWNCSSDILFLVPRAHLAAFNASIGVAVKPQDSRSFLTRVHSAAKVAPTACFASTGESGIVSHGVPVGAGHGCFNAFAERIGTEKIDFCFPSSHMGVAQKRNDFYQCCKNGPVAIWRSFVEKNLSTLPTRNVIGDGL